MNISKPMRHTAWSSVVSTVLSIALLGGGIASMASQAMAATGGPTATLSSTSGTTTSVSPIPVTITFNQMVGTLDTSKIIVTNGTFGTVTANASNTAFSFNVTPTAPGTVTVMVQPDAAFGLDSQIGSQGSDTLTFTYSTAADTTPPTITRQIISNPHGAEITWWSDELAKGAVAYGLTSSYGSSTPMDTDFATTHYATITGLTPSTEYHYEIRGWDAAGNQGTTGELTFTTPAEGSQTVAPTITNVVVSNIGTSTATVTWMTDLASNSQVLYGTTTALGASTTVDSNYVTSHSVMLTGLTPNTVYHFKVRSLNNYGTTDSTDYTFTTSNTSTNQMPVISNIDVNGVCATGATITWNSDISAMQQVMYGTTSGLGSTTVMNTTGSTAHSVTLTNLIGNTVYHYVVSSVNGSSTATSTDHTFTTNGTTCGSADNTTLHVTGIDSISTIASPTNSFSDGWKWVMHITAPSNENAFRMKFGDFTNGTGGVIPANGNIRISTAQGSNASTTDSGFVSAGNSYGDWIMLNGDMSSTTAGRQFDVIIEVKIPVGTATGSYSTTFGAQSVPSTATSTTP